MTKEHIDTTDSTVSIDGTEIGGIAPGSLPFPKPKRDTKDVTTIKDHAKRKGLKILDPGNVSFSGIYIPNDPGQLALRTASSDAVEHTIQVTVPEAGLIFEYQAYVGTEYPDEEDESTLTFNCELECTGGFIRSITSASVTSIVFAGSGVACFPSNMTTAVGASDNVVVASEASGVSSDTIKVTAAAASYIGISYDQGVTWTKLTSNSATSISSAYYPATGKLSNALLKIMEDDKATRFINVYIVRAS